MEKKTRIARLPRAFTRGLGVALALPVVTAVAAGGLFDDLALVSSLHQPMGEHMEQSELLALVRQNHIDEAFEEAFEHGDELFETAFNALDGVGANVGRGQRFTRVPRADLRGSTEWANHKPSRATGPNSQACADCHRLPGDDGAGTAADNVHRDPLHGGTPSKFIQRNTPHLFGAGAVQRLAEEMTEELQHQRRDAEDRVCATGRPMRVRLGAKGLSFGSLTIQRIQSRPCRNNVDTREVSGVDRDLVVRPFQWKGSVAFLRDFNRDAAHNELGMQAVEIVGQGVDGDFDGIVDEMSVGDLSVLSVYTASQPRPTTKVELAELGLIPALTPAEEREIARGEAVFRQARCASCHTPRLLLDDPVFSEPSQNASYRDRVFPAGQDPTALGVSPLFPLTFDLTSDQPDNVLRDDSGQVTHRLGSLATDANGRAIVELYGDLKRHDMGSGLAEAIDETGSGASVFLTENLWGVGTTPPYLHDGRATTLAEAILAHGGEATQARDAFRAQTEADQRALTAFLENLVLYKVE